MTVSGFPSKTGWVAKEAGFEPLVALAVNPVAGTSAAEVLSHLTRIRVRVGAGVLRSGRLTACVALGKQLLGLPAVEFKNAPALHLRIEDFEGPAAGVDLIVVGEIGEPLEDAEQLLVPEASPDLHIAGATLGTERPEPRELVATLGRRRHGEAAEGAHQLKRLALPGLPRILAEPDADRFPVLCGGIDQQSLDIAWVGPPPHHVEEPIAAVLIAAELDADRPIGVVELGLFGRGEIPITDDAQVRRHFVDDGTPLPLEYSPAAGRIFQLPPSSRSRSSTGSDNSQA